MEGFYDDLAEDYHLIFADWERSMDYQWGVLESLLRDHDRPVRRVLDAACGIGTQALPLARAGYDVTATDVSAAAVGRCAREAAGRVAHAGRDRLLPADRQRAKAVCADSDLAKAAMRRAHASMSDSCTISTGECM